MASPTLNILSRLLEDKFDLPVAAQVPDPDRKIRIAQAVAYKDRLWYCIACFIALISVCHWFSVLYQIRRKIPPHSVRGKVSITRLPAALLNVFRALVFRQTLSIGKSYTLNVAEVFLTAAYIVLIFTWSLVNCASYQPIASRPKSSLTLGSEKHQGVEI